VLDDERLAVGVSDRAVLDVEPGGATLRGVMVERKVAIEPVPRPREPDGQLLDYIERSIPVDGEEGIELPNPDVARLRARPRGERAENEGRDR
jgi:hypothetical protein